MNKLLQLVDQIRKWLIEKRKVFFTGVLTITIDFNRGGIRGVKLSNERRDGLTRIICEEKLDLQ